MDCIRKYLNNKSPQFLKQTMIMLVNNGSILKQQSNAECLILVKELKFFISKYITNLSCFGLIMNHNINIPALVLCLNDLGHSLIFFEEDCCLFEILNDTRKLHINYIVSLIKIESNDLNLLGCLDQTFYLWKTDINNDLRPMRNNIFCIVKSSGSTGDSKYIYVENYCIKKNVESLSSIFNLGDEDLIYFGTPLTFDPYLVELLLAIMNQATLVITEKDVKLSNVLLFNTLFPQNGEYKHVTFLQMVPSIFERWDSSQVQFILKDSNLKILALGGEPFNLNILNYERSKKIKIFNLYGISEISCWAMCGEIKNKQSTIYLGDVLDETTFKVLKNNEEIFNGSGELFLGSSTRFCYVNDEIKKVSFRSTGDIVEIISENNKHYFKYIGRTDSIIKRFGCKLNLNLMENKIYQLINLRNKFIWLSEKNKLLLFILIPELNIKNKNKVLDKIRVKLLNSLSKYFFPDYIEIITHYPLTKHGKIDKKALIKNYIMEIDKFIENTASNIFLELIFKYLGIKFNDSLKPKTIKELGATSIVLMQLINDCKTKFSSNYTAQFEQLLMEGSLNDCLEFLKQSVEIKDDMEQNITPMQNFNEMSIKLKLLWSYNMEGCVDCSPLIIYKGKLTLVAVGSFSQKFVILDALTSEEYWIHTFPKAIEAKPVVSACKNYLFISCLDGKMYCFDLDLKIIKWEYESMDSIKSSPSFCKKETALVFGAYDKHIHCLTIQEGHLLWKTNISESIVTTPLIHSKSEQILLATLNGNCISLNENTGEKNWSVKHGEPIFSNPCFLDDNIMLIAGVQGTIICLDVLTKEKTTIFKIEGQIYSSLLRYNNAVVFASRDCNLYQCFIENSKLLKVVNLYLEEPVTSTPCIFQYKDEDIIVVACTSGSINLINFNSNSIHGKIQLPDEVFSSPAVFNGNIFVGCRNDHLCCLQI